jgi:hypothetical protein
MHHLGYPIYGRIEAYTFLSTYASFAEVQSPFQYELQ